MIPSRLILFIIATMTFPALAQPVPEGADPAHRQAALELCEVMEMEATLAASINAMMNLQMRNNQMLTQHRSALDTFFRRHMSWDALKEEFLALYMESFTEAELKEMTAFYRTPTGKKAIRLMPELVQKGAEIGIRRVENNRRELQRLIVEGKK